MSECKECGREVIKLLSMEEKNAPLVDVVQLVVLQMSEGCVTACHHCLGVLVCVGSSGDVQISDHSI
jgi:hypothetical protein